MISDNIVECIDVLKEKKYTIAFAEGASSGKICYQFASLPQSEKILAGGMVALKDHMKEYFFGIEREVLKEFGSESPEIAERMAHHLCEYLHADICVSVTGASCDEKNLEQNVSTPIFIHILFPDCEVSKAFTFKGNKVEVAEQTTAKISELIISNLTSTI